MTGKTTIAPTGALKEHLLKDDKGPLASYIHLIDVEGWKKIFMKNGFAAPTSWYKIMINGMEGEDDKRTRGSLSVVLRSDMRGNRNPL